MSWIASNRSDDSPWHLGVKREVRSEKTGRLFSSYFVAACTGKTLGGSYGQTVRDEPGRELCRRCVTINERSAMTTLEPCCEKGCTSCEDAYRACQHICFFLRGSVFFNWSRRLAAAKEA